MTVKEVKELAPLTDVYKLSPDEKYLFVVDLTKFRPKNLIDGMKGSGIQGCVVASAGTKSIKIYGLDGG